MTDDNETQEERKARLAHADGRLVLERVQRERYGFLLDHEIEMVAADPRTRLQLLLVRCGCGRFLAPAQDVAHYISIIERDGVDYVRDVSIPAGR